MDDFPGLLPREYGLKPQGKAAPMSASRTAASGAGSAFNFGVGSYSTTDHHRKSGSGSILDDFNTDISNSQKNNDFGGGFNDVFGGRPKYTTNSSSSAFDYDSIFQGSNNESASKTSSLPVYDKPVYDEEDIFEGVPGLKSSSGRAASMKYEFDMFSKQAEQAATPFDDILGNLGRSKETESLKGSRVKNVPPLSSNAFDDLIPGFVGSGRHDNTSRTTSESSSNKMEDPFVVLEPTSTPDTSSASGVFTDPLDEISNFSKSRSKKADRSSVSGGVFDDLDPLDGLGKSVPSFSSESNNKGKDKSPLRSGSSVRGATTSSKEPVEEFSVKNYDSHSQKKIHVDHLRESRQNLFDMPSVSTDSHKSFSRTTSPPPYENANPNETSSQVGSSPKSEENFDSLDEVWLTVSEVPLYTQPTSAPPPSRPPPPRPARVSKLESGSFGSVNARRKVNEFSSFPNSTQFTDSPNSVRAGARNPVATQIDELEDFAMGRTQNNVDEHAISGEEDTNSVAAASAAAMKEAMDRAEAKFKHAKEVREREGVRAARSKESVLLEKEEEGVQDAQDRERERKQREREEQDREDRRLEKEREEKEREQRRVEREREKARQAVERATREARERAAAEARERAAADARLKAGRAAVEKANAEARERAEKAAVQRVHAEARERAAAEARERAEKAAMEARERANAEAREKEIRERTRAERAAVERAAGEARERAAADARERAAVASRVNQQKNENDLESFFSSRPSSAPRPRANTSEPAFESQFQSRGAPEAARRTSVGTSSNMRKASSATNIVDDLSSIFGAAAPSGDFQDVEGETEERRRARLERHQRTQERAAKALAEKNNRDMQVQREQAERDRIGETLDAEIKRWAAGKEGNLRALLSTMQYVLWPECGWQAVSLTDLITGASVKKVYRKATLCIHPDKVQQKGANLQQKYIAEKVFDLLKEAWNKFNSEELF